VVPPSHRCPCDHGECSPPSVTLRSPLLLDRCRGAPADPLPHRRMPRAPPGPRSPTPPPPLSRVPPKFTNQEAPPVRKQFRCCEKFCLNSKSVRQRMHPLGIQFVFVLMIIFIRPSSIQDPHRTTPKAPNARAARPSRCRSRIISMIHPSGPNPQIITQRPIV